MATKSMSKEVKAAMNDGPFYCRLPRPYTPSTGIEQQRNCRLGNSTGEEIKNKNMVRTPGVMSLIETIDQRQYYRYKL